VSLRLQAVVLAFAVVAVVVVATAGVTHRAVSHAVERSVTSEIETVAARAAMELATPMRHWDSDAVSRIVEQAMRTETLASVTIIDHRGEVVVRRLRDDPASENRSRTLALSAAAEPLRKAVRLEKRGERLGWSCRAPVWADASNGDPARLLGFVTVTGSDAAVRRATAALPEAAAIAGLASLLLAGPIAAWGAAGLVRPVRRVAAAAVQLETGKRPEPLRARGPREMRALVGAFNRMSDSLHQAIDDLEAHRAQLERQVEDRTRQLATVNEMLQSQVRSKNEFLRSVSHDLGAPLRNIAGMADLVLTRHAEGLAPDAVHALERIGANVRIEADMLAELLELSRNSERVERLEPLDVAKVAAELAQSLSDDLRRRGVELIVAPGLPVIRAGRTDLWMLLQNLADNALKHMGEADERRVEIGPLDDPPVGFVVADTGPGIPKRERERVFRVFEQGAGAADGRGVGLAVVRSVVDRWGGDVRLVCPPQGGSRFEIRLPPARLDTRDPHPRPHDRRNPHGRPPGRQAAA
jgi:signal transduction histidine kinase